LVVLGTVASFVTLAAPALDRPAAAASAPADLVVFASPVGATVRAGANATFKISVRNVGGATSTGQVDLTVSRYGSYTGSLVLSGAGWSCPAGGSTCVHAGTVASGGSLPDLTAVTAVGRGFPSYPGTISINSQVSGGGDAVTADNSTSAQLAVVAGSSSDLVSVVTPVGSAAKAGSNASFKVAVRNLGQAASSGQVEVAISRGGAYAGSMTASGSGWSCPAGGSTCVSSGSAAAGGALPDLTVTTPVASYYPSSPGYIYVAANLTNTSDGVSGNESATGQLPVVAATGVDLATTVTSDATTVRAGATAGFKVSVRNFGQAASSGQVEVSISRGGAYAGTMTFAGSGWSCPAGGSTCVHPGPVAAGAALPDLAVSSPVYGPDFTSPGYLYLSASTTNTSDGVRGNESGNAQVETVARSGAEPAVDLATHVSGTSVALGAPSSFAVSVTNGGTTAASGQTSVQVYAPSGATISGSGWTCTSGGACSRTTSIAAGAAAPDLTVSVPGRTTDAERTLGVSASVTHALDTDNPYNNSGSAVIALGGAPIDLSMQLTNSGSVAPGGTLVTTATVTNQGTATATDRTSVQLYVPSGTTAAGTGWTCTAGFACTNSGSIAPGASLPALTLTTTIPTADPSRTFGLSGSLQQAQDATATNNSHDVTAVVGGAPTDLTVQIGLDGPAVTAGRTATATVQVTNTGSAAAGSTTVQAYVPYSGGSASGDGWTCSAGLTCVRSGTVAANSTLPPITVRTSVPAGTVPQAAGFSASVTNADDAVTSNNSIDRSLALAATSADPDLGLAISGPTKVAVGAEPTATVTVTNSGSTDLSSFRLIPAGARGLQVTSLSGAGFTCTAASCTWPTTLGPGENASIEVKLRVGEVAFGQTYLTVSARSADSSSTLLASTTLASTVQDRSADLVSFVSPVGSSVKAGGEAAFKISVRNVGGVTSSGQTEVTIGRGGAYGGSMTFGGSGWSCPATTAKCVHTGTIPAGGALPDLTATTSVAKSFPSYPGYVYVSSSVRNASDGVSGNDDGNALLSVVAASPVDLVTSVAPVGTKTPAGGNASFKVSVRNLGQSASSGQIEVNLSRAGAYAGSLTFAGTGWSCPASGSVCAYNGAVAAGAAVPDLTLTTGVARGYPSYPGYVSVSATTTNSSDAVVGNEGTTSYLPIVAPTSVDLATTVSAVGTSVRAGSPAAFKVSVRNFGQVASTGQVEVSLSRGGAVTGSMTFAGTGWSCPANGSVCVHPGPVGAGAALPDLTATTPVYGPDLNSYGYVSVAATTTNSSDALNGNDGGNAQIELIARTGGELAVDLSAHVSGSPVAAGASSSFAVTIANSGTAPAVGQTSVQVYAPSGATYSGAGWTCSNGGACTRADAIAAGAAAPDIAVSVPGRVVDSDRQVGVSASVSHPQDTEMPGNNNGGATIAIGGAPVDLTVNLASSGPVAPGATATATATVANSGATAATEPTTLQVYAPSGTTATGTGWTCTASLACVNDGPIAAGGTLPGLMLSTPITSADPARTFGFSASVQNAQDATGTNNTHDITTAVGGAATDLTVQIGVAGPAIGGQELVLPVVVSNNGAAVPAGTATTVQVYAPFASATASGDGWACTSGLACTRTSAIAASSDLPAITLRNRVPDGISPGTYGASASVVNDADVVRTNDSTSVSFPATGGAATVSSASASLDLSVSQPDVRRGDTVRVRFEIAPPVPKLDTSLPFALDLPAGLSYKASSLSGATLVSSSATKVAMTMTVPASAGSKVATLDLVVSGSAALGSQNLGATLDLGSTGVEQATAALRIVAPSITSVTPGTVGRAASVSVSVKGHDLNPATQVQLVSGGTSIDATSIAAQSDGLLASFDLSSAAPGTWSVVVKSTGTTTTASGAVKVVDGGLINLALDATGPTAIRLNAIGRYSVTVTNNGTIDALEVPVAVKLPTWVELVVTPEERAATASMVDWLVDPTDGSDPILTTAQAATVKAKVATATAKRVPSAIAGIDVVTAGFLARVPAGQSRSFTVLLKPKQQGDINVRFSLLKDGSLDPSTGQVTRLTQRIAVPQKSGSKPDAVAPKHRDGSVNTTGIPVSQENCTGASPEEQQILSGACGAAGGTWRGLRHIQDGTTEIGKPTSGALIEDTGGSILDAIFSPVSSAFSGLLELWRGAKAVFTLYDTAEKVEKEFPNTRMGVQSIDPNDKLGPVGAGPEHYVAAGELMPYTIRFENLKTASAPAQRITLVDQLDTDFDWTTAKVTSLTLGEVTAAFGPATTANGVTTAKATLLAAYGGGTTVTADAVIDTATGKVEVAVSGPDQLDDPFNPTPFGDFLPPNVTSPEGEGSVNLQVRPKSDLATGTVIINKADIVFDDHLGGPTIPTPPVSHKIDATPPAVAVTAMSTDGDSAAVGWTATDANAGVGEQQAIVELDGKQVSSVQLSATQAVADIPLDSAGAVRIGVFAIDKAGNRSAIAWSPSKTFTPGLGAPGAPTIGAVTAGDGRATVNWTAPTSTGGSPITGYIVTPYIAGVAKAPVTSSGTGTSKVVTGLTNGTTYAFKVAAVNAVGTGTPSATSAFVIPRAPFSPFASWSALVKRQYVDLTTKQPTASQLSSWVSQLTAGTKTVGDLDDSLRRGPENLANVDPVVRVYRAFLGRAPDAGGLKFWIARKRNVAPAKTWSVTQIATDFTKSNEFKTKYGSLTNRQFVTRIYTDVLGRNADAAGVNYWTAKIDSKAKTKAQVMVGFSESNEYKTKQAQNTDVAVAYIYLLGRAPTPGEATDWVDRQKSGTSHVALLTELLTSAKYATHING
jgi:hypothetical protein